MNEAPTARGGKRRGHGEGSITKLGDGRWQGRVDLGYVKGKRKRKAVYGATKREVQEKLARARHQAEQGLPLPDERQTVGQFLERWLTETVRNAVRPTTYTSYASYVNNHLIPDLGKIPLAKLAPADIQAFLNTKRADGLTPRTVQYLRAILRRALEQALRWGLVGRNAAALTAPPRLDARDIEPLTHEQVLVLLNAIRGDRLEAMYTVAVALGLRQGEILGLRWEDIDLRAGTLTVRHALQKVEKKPTLVEPKTRRSRRTLALPDFAVTALRSHKARQLEERLVVGSSWEEWGLVFTTPSGTPLDPSNVTHRYQAILAAAGLPRQRFHDLRHCCASLLLAQGLTLKDVMETLGHSQISLTANLYGHLYVEQRREVAARMHALLGQGG
jgi:integrase